MTEGMEDFSEGPGSASPAGDTGQVPEEKQEEKPEEKPEETEAEAASGGAEEASAAAEEEEGGDAAGDGGHAGALGIMALPGTCCVCIEMEQINNCLHSEKICILPILACLLSLALCTAGLKWVFADKIFEYKPPTHLDPIPIGQDPIIISVDPALGLTVSIPRSSAATVSLSTPAAAVTSGRPEVFLEEKSTRGPYAPPPPPPPATDATTALKSNADRPSSPKKNPDPQTTQELNDILITTISSTSTTTTMTKTSSHVTRCSDSQKKYCVNGGECFTLEIMPGSTKFLCRCPNEFTGDRCQNYVMTSFYKAEELYQKRILTITGICIALLVVGIMCVVAYCKTKKQRKALHDRLRQNLRNKRKNMTGSTRGRQVSNLPLQDLQLTNQCNGIATQHAAEKETETTLSTSKYAQSAPEATTFTHISSQRRASADCGPTQLSPVSCTSPQTPGSPPSEVSAPLSSQAISVPSVALSPSAEEERPLLSSKTSKPSGRDQQKRNSAHYNHGQAAHSLPPSPVSAADNGNYQIIPASGQAIPPEKLASTNNFIDNKRAGIADGHVPRHESAGDNALESETEDPRGEKTPFFPLDSTTALLLRAMESSRTNPASSADDLPVLSSCAAAE